MPALNSTGLLAMTRARLLALASLALVWWLALLGTQYRPLVQGEVSARIQEARRRMPSLRLDWRSADGRPNAVKLALLIEARPLPQLAPLVVHMASVVPPDWRLLFIGSQRSVVGVARAPAVKHHQATGRLAVRVLPPPWSMETREDVFRLLTDVRFYDEFLPGVEWLFKYEHDSILCANSPQSLDDWLGWSWAGAPRAGQHGFSGTGGLSLRRVSAVRRALGSQKRHNDSEPEDEWFGKRLSAMAREKVASDFQGSLAVQDASKDKPMGFHVQGGGNNLDHDVWKDPEMRRKLFEYCPELSMIVDMKLERERCPWDDRQGGRASDDEPTSMPAMEVHTLKHDDDAVATMSMLPPQPRAQT